MEAHVLYQTLLTTIQVSWKLDTFASGLGPGEEVTLLSELFASGMGKGHLCGKVGTRPDILSLPGARCQDGSEGHL